MKFNADFYLKDMWNMYFGEDYQLTEKDLGNDFLEYAIENKKTGETKTYKFDLQDYFREYKSKEVTEKELADTLTWEYFSDTLPSLYELNKAEVDVHVLWTLIWIAMQSKKS